MKYFSELPKNFDSKISCDDPYDVFLKPPNFEGIFGSKSIFSLQTNNGIIWPFKELYESYLNDSHFLKIYAKEILDALPDVFRADEIDEKEEKAYVLDNFQMLGFYIYFLKRYIIPFKSIICVIIFKKNFINNANFFGSVSNSFYHYFI